MKVLTALFTIIGIIIFVGLLGSLPVWLLWNSCLVGAIDGVQPIGWFQSWGIMMLVQLLFKMEVKANG